MNEKEISVSRAHLFMLNLINTNYLQKRSTTSGIRKLINYIYREK